MCLFPPSTTSLPGKETGIRCTFPFPVRPLHLQRRQKWPFDEGRGGTTTGGGARAVLIIGKGGKEAAGGRKKRSKVLRNIWFKSREQHCESKRKAPRGDTGGGEKNREKSRCSSSVCTRCTQFSNIPQEPFAIPLYDCCEKISISASFFSFSAAKKSSNRET